MKDNSIHNIAPLVFLLVIASMLFVGFRKEALARDRHTRVVEVTNPATGRTWMDRNLGASRAARNSTDEEAYGDMYQWGRAADGHQKRSSGITATQSSTDTPRHGSFIVKSLGNRYDPRGSDGDWRSTQNTNLWQGVYGANNPCPPGYRLPTKAEWEEEIRSWNSNDSAGAFASPLKLTAGGERSHTFGNILDAGSAGRYWSSTIDDDWPGVQQVAFALRLFADYMMWTQHALADGCSVRCIKD